MSVPVNHHHAGAVKHHQPQGEEAGDAKRQSGDGDFHFNISKMPAAFTRGYLPGAGAGVAGAGAETGGSAGAAVVSAAGAGAAVSAFAGIFNFLPTLILVVVKLFAACSALMVVPCFLAILLSVSPDLTV